MNSSIFLELAIQLKLLVIREEDKASCEATQEEWCTDHQVIEI